MGTNTGYIELSKAKIQDKKNLVISKNAFKPGFTLALQVIFEEEKRKIAVFMKGAIYMEDLEALYSLRDALNEAITKTEDAESPKSVKKTKKV